MEEVQKTSKPGSVAQMKAHFEAHFKRAAELRAAAKATKAAGENNYLTCSEQSQIETDIQEEHVENLNDVEKEAFRESPSTNLAEKEAVMEEFDGDSENQKMTESDDTTATSEEKDMMFAGFNGGDENQGFENGSLREIHQVKKLPSQESSAVNREIPPLSPSEVKKQVSTIISSHQSPENPQVSTPTPRILSRSCSFKSSPDKENHIRSCSLPSSLALENLNGPCTSESTLVEENLTPFPSVNSTPVQENTGASPCSSKLTAAQPALKMQKGSRQHSLSDRSKSTLKSLVNLLNRTRKTNVANQLISTRTEERAQKSSEREEQLRTEKMEKEKKAAKGARNKLPGVESLNSFGRFVPGSLCCGKKYTEEAQKSSEPGSLAQMKAHFEARFKRAIELRAAAKAAKAAREHPNLTASEQPHTETDLQKEHMTKNDNEMEFYGESPAAILVDNIETEDTEIVIEEINGDFETQKKMKTNDTAASEERELSIAGFNGGDENEGLDCTPRKIHQGRKLPLQKSYAENIEIPPPSPSVVKKQISIFLSSDRPHKNPKMSTPTPRTPSKICQLKSSSAKENLTKSSPLKSSRVPENVTKTRIWR